MSKLVGLVQLMYILWGFGKFKEISFTKFGFYFFTNFTTLIVNFQILHQIQLYNVDTFRIPKMVKKKSPNKGYNIDQALFKNQCEKTLHSFLKEILISEKDNDMP